VNKGGMCAVLGIHTASAPIIAHSLHERRPMLCLPRIIIRNDPSMPNSTSNPIQEVWIIRSREQPPVLLLPLRLLLLPSHKSLVQLL
jgi:hypothetical protein